MGRLPSWMIVAAVGAVVVLAAADALRSSGEDAAPRESGQTSKSSPIDLEGVIVVGPNCASLRAFRLADLGEVAIPQQTDCDGLGWSEDKTLYASCFSGQTVVGTSDGRPVERLAGCSPAWRPDGALSVIRGGNLVLWRRHARQVVFLSREELADELAGALESGRTYRLDEVAWHGTQAFFGIVAGEEPWQRALIAYAPEGVNDVIPELGQDISSVRVSPAGSYVAFARETAGREIVLLDGSGREQPLPRIGNARAIAWSPDERWVALSTRTTTFIARAGTTRIVLQIPAGGESLAWLP